MRIISFHLRNSYDKQNVVIQSPLQKGQQSVPREVSLSFFFFFLEVPLACLFLGGADLWGLVD